MEPCQSEPSPAEWSRAPGELSGRRANKRGRRSGRRRKVGPGATGEGEGAGNRGEGWCWGRSPHSWSYGSPTLMTLRNLGAGGQRSLWNLIVPTLSTYS